MLNLTNGYYQTSSTILPKWIKFLKRHQLTLLIFDHSDVSTLCDLTRNGLLQHQYNYGLSVQKDVYIFGK